MTEAELRDRLELTAVRRSGVVRYGAVWFGVVACGGVWCGAVWCGVVRCGAVSWEGLPDLVTSRFLQIRSDRFEPPQPPRFHVWYVPRVIYVARGSERVIV